MNERLAALRDRFQSILPRIERHATIYFRNLKCPAKKDDAIAEMVALCCYADLGIMRRLRKKSFQARRFC